MRITVNGDYREISVKRKCDSEKWNVGAGKVDGKTEFAKSLNSYLDVLQRKVYDARIDLLENDHQVTAENIKTLLLGKEISVHKYMLMVIFKHHNEQMAALVGSEYAAGTLERYTTSYNHTKSFLEWKYQHWGNGITLAHRFFHDFSDLGQQFGPSGRGKEAKYT